MGGEPVLLCHHIEKRGCCFVPKPDLPFGEAAPILQTMFITSYAATSGSLSTAPDASVLVAAVSWLEGTLLGTIATSDKAASLLSTGISSIIQIRLGPIGRRPMKRFSFPLLSLAIAACSVHTGAPAQLTGHWVLGQDCARRNGTSILPNGTYAMADGAGRWSLTGDVLTVVGERAPSVQYFGLRLGDPGIYRVRFIDQNKISVQSNNGRANFYQRCN